MNIIEISCPAKTFILGEYAVLDGGPAIVLNTSPRFTGRLQKSSKAAGLNLPENSPAGQWVRRNPGGFQGLRLEWIGARLGGMGFSSAQFNILYAYSAILRDGGIDQIKPQDIWRSYRDLKFEGFIPSGADVITQWVGGLSLFRQEPLSVETLTSALPNLQCSILRTGEYFETHKYLKNFQLSDVSSLKEIAHSGAQAMESHDEEGFIAAVNDYRKALKNKNYTSAKSLELLEKIAKIPSIKACKGCGTMGAETLIAFYKNQDADEAEKALSFLERAAGGEDLTYGVAFHKLTKPKEALP